MMQRHSLKNAFGPAFQNGLTHIGFFTRKTPGLTAAKLIQEACQFQDVIRQGKMKEIHSVD